MGFGSLSYGAEPSQGQLTLKTDRPMIRALEDNMISEKHENL